MKILSAIAGYIVKLIAGSFVWLIVAFVLSFPLGLLIMKIVNDHIKDSSVLNDAPNNHILLLFVLYVITCFVGVLLARVVAVSIKTLADKKLEQKIQKS